MKLYDTIHALIQAGVIVSAYALDGKGLAAAVSKMAFGNKLGVTVNEDVSKDGGKIKNNFQQSQKAGDNAEQVQIGGIKRGR